MLRVLGLGSIRDHLQQANVHHRFAQVIVWSWSLPTSHAALLDPNLKARPQGLFTHTTHPQILISTGSSGIRGSQRCAAVAIFCTAVAWLSAVFGKALMPLPSALSQIYNRDIRLATKMFCRFASYAPWLVKWKTEHIKIICKKKMKAIQISNISKLN